MSTIREIYYEKPIVNRMTQGSIINGCVADAFPGEEVFGLIITPRCDVGHEGKVDSVHYLPVVSFEKWFDVIAKPKIKTIWRSAISSQLDNKFARISHCKGVMNVGFTYDDLLKITEENVKKEADKREIIRLLDSYFDRNEVDFNYYLLDGEGKDAKKHELIKYLSRLEGDGIAPYYLLEAWKGYGKEKHLVVMLRDVHRIQYSTAMKIKAGVLESELSNLNMSYNDLFLTNDPKNFFWVQAEILSPFIEHIMQSFVYNFSRIGVDDRPVKTVECLFNSVKSIIE